MTMNKHYVIFKQLGHYRITNKSNYDKYIIDLNQVMTIKGVDNFDEAKRGVMKWLGLSEEQIINETGE